MKLEHQVTSLELSKRLKELGVKQESLFYWMEYTNKRTGVKEWDLNNHGQRGMNEYQILGEEKSGRSWNNDWDGQCSAFTVAELGEMLPFSIKFQKHVCYLSCEKNIPDYGGWFCKYESSDIIRPTKATDIFTADTEADARANMLIYLLENGLITI